MTLSTDIFVMSGGRALLAIVTILTNCTLVFVTLKAKNLNSTCNWLIGANSACIAIYSFTYFIQFGIVFFSPSGIPLWQCCLLVSVPLFFMCCQYVLFPLIAFDRLISAIFPFKQMGFRYKRRYMLFSLVASSSFGIFMVAAAFNKSLINFSENLVRCQTHDAAPDYFANCSWVLNVCSVVLYVALWVRVKLMSSSASGEILSNEAITRKVLFSLMVIFLVELCGWLTTWSVKLVLTQFGVDATTQLYVLAYCIYVMQLSLALNAPILYALSSEYRSAFRAILRFGTPSHPNGIIYVQPKGMNGTKTRRGATTIS
ncbi:hypothetical protein niasHT_027077 [Heterodera trifolii]|uniref:G_PROTEIN_RECEP_F1_2 domain-containing protein n=1 Tax=Heterodera trifolii TaxID=157864 RepID=A0ABD2KTU6_9BILA